VRSIGVATCAGLDADPTSSFRGGNVDPDWPLLWAALDEVDLAGVHCVWDDERVDWDRFDLTVVRSTWDYSNRRDDFLAWAANVPRLFNPYDVLEYSSDKHYLADLGEAGHRIVPSFFCDVGEAPVFPTGDFVVKPCVGAGSVDAERFGADELEQASAHVRSLHERGRDVLIQPYVSSVDEFGERALVFIDGGFSHAMTKGPMLNTPAAQRDALFRLEQMKNAQAEPDALVFAERVLGDLEWRDLLYARVDLVRDDHGWILMELELVEPFLFLQFEPEAARRLALGIARRREGLGVL
jgi:glutathione synthase/RimK-type ligase-like ATP-grasp enzyme